MKLSVVLFQTDFDRFSALAFETGGRDKRTWINRYDSFKSLAASLRTGRIATPEEIEELGQKRWFEIGSPILKVRADLEDLEAAGFERAVPCFSLKS